MQLIKTAINKEFRNKKFILCKLVNSRDKSKDSDIMQILLDMESDVWGYRVDSSQYLEYANNSYFITYNGDIVAGFMFMPSGVYDLAITEKYRGQGLFPMVLYFLKYIASLLRFDEFQIRAKKYNTRAIHLYSKYSVSNKDCGVSMCYNIPSFEYVDDNIDINYLEKIVKDIKKEVYIWYFTHRENREFFVEIYNRRLYFKSENDLLCFVESIRNNTLNKQLYLL